MKRWWAVVALGIMYFAASWLVRGGTGLMRTVVVSSPDRAPDSRRVDVITVADIDASARTAGVTATWQGVWEIPSDGFYELALASRGRSTWTVDGILTLTTASETSTNRVVWLDTGFHRMTVFYEIDPSEPFLTVAAAPYGQTPKLLAASTLKPRPPTRPALRAAGATLRALLGWVTLAALIFAIRGTVARLSDRWQPKLPGWMTRRARAAAWLAVACIVVHGALLRIDAITGRYGVVASPRWLAAVQTRTIAPPLAIRPASIRWDPEPVYPHKDGVSTHYRSDPYIYLDAARHMSSFYTAHFREPLFPFATKMSLWLLSDQDVAVSFTSAFFSTTAIVLTYLLGAAFWSRGVGLIAALEYAIDVDVISLASLGWRDDAYVAITALCAFLMLRWWRTDAAGDRSWRMPVAAGVGLGLAILTRFMALPYVAVAIAWMVLGHGRAWRQYLKPAGIAAAAAMLVAAPYFINCWRVYGDPLATFNIHGGVYSVTEHQGAFEGSTASYVTEKIERAPIAMLDTMGRGVTTYPFSNKWHGLDPWWRSAGVWAERAALAGLVVFAAVPRGRWLLLWLVAALVPFSFTWTIDPDFRFTEFAYPFFLTAMGVALSVALGSVRALIAPRQPQAVRERRSVGWRSCAAVIAIGVAALWIFDRVSPAFVAAESLRHHEEVTISTGSRDTAFFKTGWSSVMPAGNATFRIAREEGVIVFRLPAPADYSATLRMDPFPHPLAEATERSPEVELLLNGIAVTTIALKTTPGRVGSCDVVLPHAATRAGVNRLIVRIKRPPGEPAAAIRPGLSEGDAAAIWYLRIRPASAARPPS